MSPLYRYTGGPLESLLRGMPQVRAVVGGRSDASRGPRPRFTRPAMEETHTTDDAERCDRQHPILHEIEQRDGERGHRASVCAVVARGCKPGARKPTLAGKRVSPSKD